jgi:hypothetical protein
MGKVSPRGLVAQMTFIAFAPTKAYRDDPSKHNVLRVTDGDQGTTGREWFVDMEHLAATGTLVLDSDIDGPIIAALELTEGWTRVDAGELTRTLPGSLDDMNQQQLLATPEGAVVPGGADLSKSKLRSEMAQIRKDAGDGENGVVEAAKEGVTEEGVKVADTGLKGPMHAGETAEDTFGTITADPDGTVHPDEPPESGPTVDSIKGKDEGK